MEKAKEESGITEVDIESYADTKLATRADNLLGSPLGRLNRLSVESKNLLRSTSSLPW